VRTKVVVPIVAAVVVAVAAFAAFRFFSGDESLDVSTEGALGGATTTLSTGAATSAPGTTGAGDGTAPATTAASAAGIDGTWTVQPGDGVFAGYEVEELFAGDTIKKTAVGRSPAVTGTLTAAGTTISAVSITVDTTQLASDSGRRDGVLRSRGLQTEQFPTASFVLTQPIELGTLPPEGTEIDVRATGELTLKGVTKPVTLDLKAQRSGERIAVAGGTEIALADFGIEPPSIPNVVTVDDRGQLKFQLLFARD
jgi:polyisoprenoid-binding protein YceI